MTFERFWATVVKNKTDKTITKKQLKYYCEKAYEQGQNDMYDYCRNNEEGRGMGY